MLCFNCNREKINTEPFCTFGCKDNYLIRLELSAYVKDELKYPEFIEELREWYRLGDKIPKITAKKSELLKMKPNQLA